MTGITKEKFEEALSELKKGRQATDPVRMFRHAAKMMATLQDREQVKLYGLVYKRSLAKIEEELPLDIAAPVKIVTSYINMHRGWALEGNLQTALELETEWQKLHPPQASVHIATGGRRRD